jgi:septum formation protein
MSEKFYNAAEPSGTTDPTELILASGSPRRRELLSRAGYAFTVIPPTVDECAVVPKLLRPNAYAESLAYFKARSVAENRRDARVLGADTIVTLDGDILGKPDDADHARQMLSRLSRNRHAVITGVALLGPGHGRVLASQTTWVCMRPMSDAEIDAYIDSGEWQGKAGAYAIQETADRFVTRLEGSFSNVVGLPMELIAKLLPPPREAES